MGIPVANLDKKSFPNGFERVNGTSFGKSLNFNPATVLTNSQATPMVAGVVACLLKAGQAGPNPDATKVRDLLDKWSPVTKKGLKVLKNAPGLTLITPK